MNLFQDDDLIFDDDDNINEDESGFSYFEEIDDEGFLLPENLNQNCIGHDALVQQLLELYHKNKIPHSIIFTGLQGIGKTTIAFQFVRFLLKYGKSAGDPNQDSFFDLVSEPKGYTSFYVEENDPIFKMMAAGAYPDFLHIQRETDTTTGKKNAGLKVEALRKIEPFLHKTSSDGGWRIVLVEDADTMNNSAQNAILKILEEPPKNVLIILIAHRIGKIIPTVRSRSRVFHFDALSEENMNTLLARKCSHYSQADRDAVFAMAKGSAGKALMFLDEDGLSVFKKFLELSEDFPNWNWQRVHEFSNEISSPAQDKMYRMFTAMVLWVLEEVIKIKAREAPIPDYLSGGFVSRFMNKNSLQGILQIQDDLKRNFERCDFANLDRRDAVRTCFLMISQ